MSLVNNILPSLCRYSIETHNQTTQSKRINLQIPLDTLILSSFSHRPTNQPTRQSTIHHGIEPHIVHRTTWAPDELHSPPSTFLRYFCSILSLLLTATNNHTQRGVKTTPRLLLLPRNTFALYPPQQHSNGRSNTLKANLALQLAVIMSWGIPRAKRHTFAEWEVIRFAINCMWLRSSWNSHHDDDRGSRRNSAPFLGSGRGFFSNWRK